MWATLVEVIANMRVGPLRSVLVWRSSSVLDHRGVVTLGGRLSVGGDAIIMVE